MSDDMMDDDFYDSQDDNMSELSSEEEIEDENDPFALTKPEKKLKTSSSFEVIPIGEILSQSKNIIDQVKSVTGLEDSSAVAILLRKYKWNKERLIDAWIEDSDRVLKNAGLFLDEKPSDVGSDEEVECLICLEDCPIKEMFGLGCGHRYCESCWKGYLENAVKQGARSINTKCPARNCPYIIHERHFKKFVDEKAFQSYSKFLLRSFVDDNSYTKWCPSPGCENAIQCERISRRPPVVCVCGFKFCFRCADYTIGDHAPTPCDFLDKWRQKATDESENVKWMIANTKNCPKCRSPIEKNGGCMHMTCTNGSCAYEFCWMCRGPWTEHGTATGGWYSCNKYEASKAQQQDQKAEDTKTELETYMFYYHRYESHHNAGKFATQQRERCEEKQEEIFKKFGLRSQDSKFLMEATEQLMQNRRVLRFSYVMGYYLNSESKSLFEHSQENLEKFTNELSELYEMSFDKIEDEQALEKWKENVANYTRVSAKYLSTFVEFCLTEPSLQY